MLVPISQDSWSTAGDSNKMMLLQQNPHSHTNSQSVPSPTEHSLLPRQGKGAPVAHVTPEPRLPWLDLNSQQLYFLRIAQVTCHAVPEFVF